MKVLFISNHYPPVVDGVADHTYHMARKFREHGHEVAVVSKKYKGYDHQKEEAGIKIYPSVKSWSFIHMVRVAKLQAQLKPDWIILQYVPYAFSSYGMPFSVALLVFLLRRIYGMRTVVFFHEYASAVGFHDNLKYLPVSISQFLIASFLKREANLSIYTLDVIAHRFKKVRHTLKLYIGSNISRDENEECVTNLRNKLAPKGEFIFCSFGMKEQRNLLEVMRRLNETEKKFKLVLIGKLSESYRKKLNAELLSMGLSQHIIITGYLQDSEVYHHIKAADLFLSFNKVDQNGRGGISTKSGAVAAAFMAATPVVGSQGHMTGSIFRDMHNVVLINPENIEYICEKILHLMNNSELRKKISVNAHSTYEEHLGWDVNFQKLINSLNELSDK